MSDKFMDSNKIHTIEFEKTTRNVIMREVHQLYMTLFAIIFIFTIETSR